MNLLELGKAIGIEGFLHCNELQKLVELAAGKDVLEVGSYRGLSAWGMGLTAKTLVCVDTFKAATDGQRQEPDYTTLKAFQDATRRYTNIRCVPLPSEKACESDEINDFDMIFIDAMHTYEEVLADIDRWRPRVRPGGLMVFHDYRHADFPGVERAVDERFGPAPEGTTEVTLRWITIPSA